jgi:hypothetical protein
VLNYLACHAAQRPVLVIYAYRDEAIDSNEHFARLVESLRRDTDARRVPLARLDFANTRNLVAARRCESRCARFGRGLHRETDDNPFFLMSSLQSLSEGETRRETRVRGAAGLLPDALRACRWMSGPRWRVCLRCLGGATPCNATAARRA